MKKALLHRDVKKREQPTLRDLAVEAFKRAGYFIVQGHWLLSRFPDGVYVDVPGLCAVVPRATIAANDYPAADSYWRCANPLAKRRLSCHCKYDCHYSEDSTMASINIRIDDELKVRAYRELEKLGVTPSELMRQALQYVAERGQLPFRPVLMTEEDEALIATVRERIAAPQRVKVSLDDL